MPEQPFTVHVDLDALAVPTAPALPPALDGDAPNRSAKRHHGSADGRLESRQRSEREHSSRAAGLGKGRSYAFRRS
ncbi:hypothetical protein [Actinoplanes sp. NPDC049265]|uniref:hypothetical protein n=1 Tax=Actinoplanes sp. NPDC049265 TaxID=3363902 RepID=UPI00371AF07D